MPVALGTVASGYKASAAGPIPTTGLLGWFDAAHNASFDAPTGDMTIWRDRSSNAVHATSRAGYDNPAYRPVRVAAAVNGLSAAYFGSPGNPRFLQTAMSASVKPFTVIAALVLEDDTARIYLGAESHSAIEFRFTGDERPRAFIPAVGDLAIATNPAPMNVASQITWTYSATDVWASYLNGAANGSGTTAATFVAGRPSQIGAGQSGAEGFKGYICEIIKYDRVLSTVERQQVESYLWWKWMMTPPPFPTTGLQLWLDASDAATFSYSSGSVVSEWRDKSGNSRHGTGIGNRDGVINGLAAVRFTYNNFLSFASFASPLTSAEVFIVLKLNAETYQGAPLGGWGTDASDSHYTFGGTIYEGWGTTTRKTLGDPVPDLFVPHLYNLRTAPGSYVAEINGGPLFSAGNTVAFRNNAHYIPRETASIEGLIAEIAMYNRVLDSVERGQVESYLGTKWGITLL